MLTLELTPETTLRELAAHLRAELRGGRRNAYDLARTLLSLAGLDSFESAAQGAPQTCPKTLRRVYSQGVPMCMSSLVQKEQVHTDTLETGQLQTLAGEAQVDAKQALSAHLRYGNPLERVTRVLTDIKALISNHCKVHNPTGLFVRLMRSGGDVQLPAAVVAKRESSQVDRPKAAQVPLRVGDVVKLFGQRLTVVKVGPARCDLEDAEGYGFGESIERALLCRVPASPPS